MSLVIGQYNKQDARALGAAEWWKCWGWIDLKLGSLRLSYQDFRLIMADGYWTDEATVGGGGLYMSNAVAP
jgi:hypothetical protein